MLRNMTNVLTCISEINVLLSHHQNVWHEERELYML